MMACNNTVDDTLSQLEKNESESILTIFISIKRNNNTYGYEYGLLCMSYLK